MNLNTYNSESKIRNIELAAEIVIFLPNFLKVKENGENNI